ncbi:hypothetical protein ACWGMA_05680 [Streptomyces asiaticus]
MAIEVVERPGSGRGARAARMTSSGRHWGARRLGRGAAARLSCSRPACADQRFPSTAAGRKAAVEHVNMHLAGIRAGGEPRGEAWCACRAADCAWHTPDTDTDTDTGRRGGARPAAELRRCGAAVRWS